MLHYKADDIAADVSGRSNRSPPCTTKRLMSRVNKLSTSHNMRLKCCMADLVWQPSCLGPIGASHKQTALHASTCTGKRRLRRKGRREDTWIGLALWLCAKASPPTCKLVLVVEVLEVWPSSVCQLSGRGPEPLFSPYVRSSNIMAGWPPLLPKDVHLVVLRVVRVVLDCWRGCWGGPLGTRIVRVSNRMFVCAHARTPSMCTWTSAYQDSLALWLMSIRVQHTTSVFYERHALPHLYLAVHSILHAQNRCARSHYLMLAELGHGCNVNVCG